MVKHLSGFVPFCGILESLFFYHLYSTTGKKPLQSFFNFLSAFFIFPNVRKTPPCLLSYLIVIDLLVCVRDDNRLTVGDA